MPVKFCFLGFSWSSPGLGGQRSRQSCYSQARGRQEDKGRWKVCSPGQGEVLRKRGQWPLACPCVTCWDGIIHGFTHLVDTAGGGVTSQVPSPRSPQPVVSAPRGEARCFAQYRLHGNCPDSANPCFPCFKQTGFMGISGITVKVKVLLSLWVCPAH